MHASDGYAIGGFLWRNPAPGAGKQPVVIINAATSVTCGYYTRFAAFLCEQGFDVLTYDYRGIGLSRPRSLRRFPASWIDWGKLDFEAVLLHAKGSFPGQPIDVVAHSIGGFIIGFAPSNHLIRRIVTMGAQHAYWRDYAPRSRYRMLVKWHLVMPLLTAVVGYFPGRILGWLEDTPSGVVRDWSRAQRRFEDGYRSLTSKHAEAKALMQQFSAVTAPTLALSVTDDDFGTVPAIERVLAYFTGSPATHLRISPESIAQAAIGHFAFFSGRHEKTLWPIPLEWLRHGRCPDDAPGTIVATGLRRAPWPEG